MTKELMDSLEKLASEKYNDDKRIDRGFAAETFLGAGPLSHVMKKKNILSNEDDSHAAANAKVLAAQGAVGGAANGLLAGTFGQMASGKRSGAPLALFAAGAATAGAALGAAQGAAGGGIIGALHDKYDDKLKREANEEELMQQEASELMESLEKVASEKYDDDKRINRGLVAESLLGTGPVGYALKKNNVLVNEDDNHTLANAKVNAAQSGVGGALYGGILGSALGGAKGAALGSLGGGALYAGAGALGGAVTGVFHDKYDDRLKRKANEEELMQQEASDLMDSLSKVANDTYFAKEAAPNPINAVKGFANKVTGGGVRAAKKDLNKYQTALDKNNTVDALKANSGTIGVAKHVQGLEALDKQVQGAKGNVANATVDMLSAQKKLGVGAGLAAGGYATGSYAADKKASENEKDMEKTASETFMNELYKEAATAILDTAIPETKQYSDPINRIKF